MTAPPVSSLCFTVRIHVEQSAERKTSPGSQTLDLSFRTVQDGQVDIPRSKSLDRSGRIDKMVPVELALGEKAWR